MPSTEYFGALVTNLGPLTTTFTAAASCETQNLAVADTLYNALWRAECDFPAIDSGCMPSASEYNALVTSFRDGDLRYQGWVPYHSPASICPAGWETMGMASMSSDSISANGVFTESLRPTPGEVEGLHAYPIPPMGYFLGALENGEEVIWCCPKNHTVDVNGVCLSTVGPLDLGEYDQFTTICNYGLRNPEFVTVTSFDGTTWDPPLLSVEDGGTTEEYTTFKETLAPTMTEGEYVVVHSMVAIALINGNGGNEKDGDNNSNGNSNSQDDKSGGGDNDDSGDGAPSSRALTLLPFTVVGLGLLVGLGVFMPW